jgi:hypothetical protein
MANSLTISPLSDNPFSRAKLARYPKVIPVLLFLYLFFMTHIPLSHNIAFSVFAWTWLSFVDELGKRIAILKIIALLAVGQWIIAPLAIDYMVGYEHMMVRTDDYLSFVLPGTILLLIGLFWPMGKDVLSEEEYFSKIREHLKKYPRLGVVIFVIGLACGLVDKAVPVQIRFVFFLLGNLIYIGAFYTLLSPAKNKNIIVGIVIALTVGSTVARGMFGELVYWAGFSVIMVATIFRPSLLQKIMIFAAGIFMIGLIQSIKMEFRMLTWMRADITDTDRFAIMGDVISGRLADPSVIFSEEAMLHLAGRANQGYIISEIMYNIPNHREYLGGETIFLATLASFIPRVLWPSKPKSGGTQNFRKFTGRELPEGTSMDLSPIGEAYGNFGPGGAWIFIFIYGLFLNYMFHSVLRIAKNHPTLILWMPLIFFQVVKVETDVNSVLNHGIKALFLTWLMYWGFRTFLNTKI